MTIGVFGGTFAPIHNGHLRLAIEAREQLGLDAVHLVPAAMPPLRAPPSVPAARRLRWVQLATAGEKGLVADDRELTRAGPSYTVDTLTQFREQDAQQPVCLLLGQDAARQLPQWHRWEALIDLAHLIFFNRPGPPPEIPEPLTRQLQHRRAPSARALHEKPAGFWWRAEMAPLAIASTDVRRRLREGLSVRGLVPDRVIDDFTKEDVHMLTLEAPRS